jgi:methenyltetrahydromethanopterin cyclohydrolase
LSPQSAFERDLSRRLAHAAAQEAVPEQAAKLCISEDDVARTVMPKETMHGPLATLQDVSEAALFLAAFPTNALTGQSMIAGRMVH